MYMVSNTGEVYSKTVRRTMKQYKINSGYMCVHIDSIGTPVHRLVAMAFLENKDPETYTEVNHINYDKTDNRAENLEWITHRGNCKYSEKMRRESLQRRTPLCSTGVRNVQVLPSGRYRAHITKDGKNKYLGVFDTIEEAKKVRDAAEKKLMEEIS